MTDASEFAVLTPMAGDGVLGSTEWGTGEVLWATLWFVLFALWIGAMVFFTVQLVRYGLAKGSSTWTQVVLLLALIWIPLLGVIGLAVVAFMYFRTIKPELHSRREAEREASALGNQPGWYPDPYNPSVSRCWDGAQWTQHVASPRQPSPSVAASTRPNGSARTEPSPPGSRD